MDVLCFIMKTPGLSVVGEGAHECAVAMDACEAIPEECTHVCSTFPCDTVGRVPFLPLMNVIFKS